MKYTLFAGAIVCACFFTYFTIKSNTAADYQLASISGPGGFIPTECWFTAGHNWPPSECFQMQVPENHEKLDGRYISFPVVVFRSKSQSRDKAPLLHLGAGGPGAPMYLDSTSTMNEFWRQLDDMSINIGRDLFLIDPRGTGLSSPLLSCGEFVDNELLRFDLNLSLQENMLLVDKDYLKCIDEFLAEGIDLSKYNSFSIAKDINAMRKAAKVDKWVLLGVSYGSTYALTITELFPETVESMILDSATFPSYKAHQDFVQRTTLPYRKLFNYCDSDPACIDPDTNMENRIWKLVDKLTEQPVFMVLNNPYNKGVISFSLNGNRLISALFEGLYSIELFQELPLVVSDLESRHQERIKPYVMNHIEYMLDRTWGDVSATAHYCFEDKPFIDFQQISNLIEELPEGYIRKSARYFGSWSKYCDRMGINSIAPVLVPSDLVGIPTLFLQGRFDSITPLQVVEKNRSNFTNHSLVTFELSHSILTADECAERLAATFIEKHQLDTDDITCDVLISTN